MQRYRIFFITVNAVHVSGGFSAHHQELKSVHTASGICQACLLLAVAASNINDARSRECQKKNQFPYWRLVNIRATVQSSVARGLYTPDLDSLHISVSPCENSSYTSKGRRGWPWSRFGCFVREQKSFVSTGKQTPFPPLPILQPGHYTDRNEENQTAGKTRCQTCRAEVRSLATMCKLEGNAICICCLMFQSWLRIRTRHLMKWSPNMCMSFVNTSVSWRWHSL